MINNITEEERNAYSLFDFARSLKNGEIANKIWRAKVHITYSFRNEVFTADSEIHIQDKYNCDLRIVAFNDNWLTPENVYTEFNPKWNTFEYNETDNTLTISSNQSSKLGSYYSVTFKQIE